MKPAPGRRLLGVALLLLLLLPLGAADARLLVIWLQEGNLSHYSAPHHFCYTNTHAPQWYDIWTRTQVRINSSRLIRITQVDSEEELEDFRAWDLIFSFLKGKLNDTSINVDLYSKGTCLKVELLETNTMYSIGLFRRFDPKLVLLFFLGLLLFFCGDMLSRSQLFYYSAGISFGLLTSLLVLVYVMSRILPKVCIRLSESNRPHSSNSFYTNTFVLKSPVYFLLLGGWSFSLYLLQLILKNLREICKSYWQYLLGYLLFVAFVSFGVCYRYGPLENKRSIKLLSWALQLLGLLLMYSGIQIYPLGLASVVIAVCAKNLDCPLRWALATYRTVKSARLRTSPPCLLTEEEYQIQGEVETRRALQELRNYCRSPDLPVWSLVSCLHYPKRFADFVNGSCHVTPSEVSAHEQEYGLGCMVEEEEDQEEEDDSFDRYHTNYNPDLQTPD